MTLADAAALGRKHAQEIIDDMRFIEAVKSMRLIGAYTDQSSTPVLLNDTEEIPHRDEGND